MLVASRVRFAGLRPPLNRIAHDVLGRTLDELPPQTRRLLTLLVDWVKHECEARDETREALRFTRREVRTATRWGDTQLKIHLSRLVELEYVIAHRGRNGLFEYELLYSADDDGKPHLCGLIGPTALADDGTRSGPSDERSGAGRAVVGEWSDAAEKRQSRAVQGEAAEAVGLARSAVNHDGGLLSLAAVAQPS